jgi:hypothetical protein
MRAAIKVKGLSFAVPKPMPHPPLSLFLPKVAEHLDESARFDEVFVVVCEGLGLGGNFLRL